MDDLSFSALKICCELGGIETATPLRERITEAMIGLTNARTGLTLGFDASGGYVIPLAGYGEEPPPPVDASGTDWPDHPFNYLFSIKACLWETEGFSPLTEARILLFGVGASGRMLVVPGRIQPDGYARFVHVLLVPSNIRPTKRTFRILAVFATHCAQLLQYTMQGQIQSTWRNETSHPAKKVSAKLKDASHKEAIIGNTPQIRSILAQIERFAPSTMTALITGETGTGKELVARALHEQSSCRTGPFIAINTTTLPSQLIESELFGHVKGAFTGAENDHPGLILKADGGTLFLDEIGDLPFDLQAKLLRVLQERQFRPVGGEREIRSEFRLICATHHNLETMVSEGAFRQDLYYRINQVRIHIPPLRERQQDVIVLAEHFLALYAQRSGQPTKFLLPETRRILLDRHYPGNIRELMAIIERAAMAAGANLSIHPDHLHSDHLEETTHLIQDFPGLPPGMTLPSACDRYEREAILKAYQAHGGNRKIIAQRLGIPLRTLAHKIERHGIE